jgi:pimeloyl-ACP methyl ester carboxylesterase
LGLLSPANYDAVAPVITRHAADVRLRRVEHTGHYIPEERPDAVVAELRRFFG